MYTVLTSTGALLFWASMIIAGIGFLCGMMYQENREKRDEP
jgi:hypothetical protein